MTDGRDPVRKLLGLSHVAELCPRTRDFGRDGDDGGDEEVPAGGEEVPAGGDEEEVCEVAVDAAEEVGEGAADATGAADDDDDNEILLPKGQ